MGSDKLSSSQKRDILLGILIATGYYYALDWPQTLQTPLKQPPYSFSPMQYNMLYFISMFPIALLSIPFGMLIDRMKLKYSVWLFLGGQVLVQLLTAIVFYKFFRGYYYLILLMRLLYGFTTATSMTILSVSIQKLIPQHHLDFALNLCYTVPMIFQALNSLISTTAYQHTHKIYVPILIGTLFCSISLISGLFILKRIKKKEQSCKGEYQQKKSQKFNIREIKEFSGEFWFFVMTVFVGECCNGPFLDNLTDLILKRFGIPYTVSGALTMIPCGLTPLCSILWFWFINKYPSKRRLIFCCIALQSVVLHLVMLLIPNSEEPSFVQYFFVAFSLLCYALAYSGFLGVVGTSITMIVPCNLTGTAYGALGFVDTLSMGLIPIVNGAITTSAGDDEVEGYSRLQYLFFPMSILYLLLTTLMMLSKRENFKRFDELRGQDTISQNKLKESLMDGEDANSTVIIT